MQLHYFEIVHIIFDWPVMQMKKLPDEVKLGYIKSTLLVPK